MKKKIFFQIFGLFMIASVIISLPACKKTVLVLGCMDSVACNYSDEVTEDNGSCIYAQENFDCTGGCINDQDGDGVCDENEILGCMDSLACNYDLNATDQLSSSCDYESCLGCIDPNAFNYSASATIDDGSCQSASTIMADTWNLSSECTGDFIGNFFPNEITILEGASDGDLILDLGTGITINGTIDSDGIVIIPSQEVGFDMFNVSVSGYGQLNSKISATINVFFSSLLLNDDCILTLTN